MKFPFLLGLLVAANSALSQSPGNALFTEGAVHEIRFHFAQPGYWDSLKVNYTLDQYMRCDVTVDGVAYPTSGVKFKVNLSQFPVGVYFLLVSGEKGFYTKKLTIIH